MNKLKKGLLLVIVFLCLKTMLAQNTNFWGISYDYGANHEGAIFVTDTLGENFEIKHLFDFSYVFNPLGGLLYASNGKFYGCATGFNSTVKGTLFEYDPITENVSVKIDFDTLNGVSPLGNLIQASNGKLYGVTKEGGDYNDGMLYEYDVISNSAKVLYHFQESVSGANPFYNVIEVSPGKLFGSLVVGGSFSGGVIYEYDVLTNTFSKKKDFGDSLLDGINPEGALFKASNGMYYGGTSLGGTNNAGVIFEYDVLNNIFTKKADFDSLTTGYNQSGRLTEAINGKLYGVTFGGGTWDQGFLFEYDPTLNTLIGKYEFEPFDYGSDGCLLNASNGKLYGQTLSGLFHGGTVFEYDALTNVYSKKCEMGTEMGEGAHVLDDPSLIEVTINSPTQIVEDKKQESIEIYPNPTNGNFSVALINNYQRASIKIYDVTGNIVFYQEITEKGRSTFKVDFEPGIYFVDLMIDGVTTTSKLIKY